ncbi:MAG TPA: transcriptional regulator [Desulfobacteraceae bacterium]|nr:transcriptional regulator [Desulfobacteraceae bacterium]
MPKSEKQGSHSGKQLDKWISERNMPGHKIGRLWKFRKEEIDEWVKVDGANTPQTDEETRENRKRES